MFGFGKKAPATPPKPPAAVPDGQRLYAIGDVHGRFDLLQSLLAQVEQDNGSRPPAETHVIMLGDLIDRGPQSREVIDFFLHKRPDFARFHFIMGNHEEMLLRVADDPNGRGLDNFLRCGGREMLESYDVPQRMLDLPDHYPVGALIDYIPTEHLAFLWAGHHGMQFGDYLFVHAGIRPGIPVDEQSASDLRWIRKEFLSSEEDHGLTVVHGHTITREPDVRKNRIGIDTGAYRSGVLTALGLEGTERWWLSTEQAA
jgi:serine/threonine protein phosphatase 1